MMMSATDEDLDLDDDEDDDLGMTAEDEAER